MTHSHRLQFRFALLGLVITVILLVLHLWLVPAAAQVQQKANVVLDGQPIFQVSESGKFSAQERAEFVNSQLREVVQSQSPPQVTVESRNQLPALFVNDRYLLTVTERDVSPADTPQEQAKIWGQQIQSALQQSQSQRSKQYIRNTSILSACLLLLVATGSWCLGWLRLRLSRAVRGILADTDQESPPPALPKGLELFFTLLLALARSLLWVVSVLYITNLFPFSRQWSYRIQHFLLSSFTAPILTLGKSSYSVTDLLILGGLLFGLVLLVRASTNLLRERILTRAGINRGAREAIAILVQYGAIFIGSLVLLQLWGFDLSSLTILASALGIGLGFGLQDIAKNFGSGLVLVFERPVQVGDFIEVAGLNGTVERIGARSTEIRTLDRVSIIVPNSRLLENEVINWSHRNPMSRLHLPVGVAYGSDPQAVKAALLEVASNHPQVLKSPPPQVLFKSFGDSALDLELLVWTTEPAQQFFLKSDLYFRIYEVLGQREIEIPFPQRDLHLRSGVVGLSPQLESALFGLAEQLAKILSG